MGQQDGDAAAAGAPQSVPVNMYEAERALVLVAPLPGVMADSIMSAGNVKPRMGSPAPAGKGAAPGRTTAPSEPVRTPTTAK